MIPAREPPDRVFESSGYAADVAADVGILEEVVAVTLATKAVTSIVHVGADGLEDDREDLASVREAAETLLRTLG